MSETKKNPDELGALWLKTGGKGDFLTGEVNGVKVVCFKNERYQEGGNLPYWRVLKPKPKTETPTDQRVEVPDDSAIPF